MVFLQQGAKGIQCHWEVWGIEAWGKIWGEVHKGSLGTILGTEIQL